MSSAQQVIEIQSKDNPLLKRIRRLAGEPTFYREAGEIWLEGEHLCRAALDRGWTPHLMVISREARARQAYLPLLTRSPKLVIVADGLFRGLSDLESPTGLGCLLEWTATHPVQRGLRTVVLDRVQDAGNVGTIMRSAAAFGFQQVVALSGTAALGSGKVLRSGMGAHFGLRCVEGVDGAQLSKLGVPLLATSSHVGQLVSQIELPDPCAWVFGHEGQGVSEALMQACSMTLRIAQPGGEESLNVAAAAAICLYESALRRGVPVGS